MAINLHTYSVALALSQFPSGFKGNLQETLNIFAESLTATISPTFPKGALITGQMGGSTPDHDVGPWLINKEWWFWNPVSGAYESNEQGVPIGTVLMWGGQGVPENWLLCDGRPVDRVIYSKLFKAVGGVWGVGDGITTFNLPPGGRFFINAPGFVADPHTPIDPGYPSQGLTSRGGAQTQPLVNANIPGPMKITIPALRPSFKETPGAYGVPSILPDGVKGTLNLNYGVRDLLGAKLGTLTPEPVNNMPPFIAVNYIIKYR
jgi:microcystin-dependent protein